MLQPGASTCGESLENSGANGWTAARGIPIIQNELAGGMRGGNPVHERSSDDWSGR